MSKPLLLLLLLATSGLTGSKAMLTVSSVLTFAVLIGPIMSADPAESLVLIVNPDTVAYTAGGTCDSDEVDKYMLHYIATGPLTGDPLTMLDGFTYYPPMTDGRLWVLAYTLKDGAKANIKTLIGNVQGHMLMFGELLNETNVEMAPTGFMNLMITGGMAMTTMMAGGGGTTGADMATTAAGV